MYDTFDSRALAVDPEQDPIAAMDRHADPDPEILSSRIRSRPLCNGSAPRQKFIDEGYCTVGIAQSDVVADFFEIDGSARREPKGHPSLVILAYLARSLANTASPSTDGPLSIPSWTSRRSSSMSISSPWRSACQDRRASSTTSLTLA